MSKAQPQNQYENLARLALAGKEKTSRTGVNTIGIFGHQMRFNMSAGEFPLVTTKKVFTRGIFEELKWFIKGETNITPLLEKNVHIWDAWAVDDKKDLPVEHRRDLLVKAFKDKGLDASAVPEFASNAHLDAWYTQFLNDNSRISLPVIPNVEFGPLNNELGPVYGEIWRRFPVGVPVAALIDLVKNCETKNQLQDSLLRLASDPKYKSIDQLRDLLDNLEKTPYSRRHLISAWAPSVLPNEKISPQDNVREGKQALAACHTFWQVYVEDMEIEEAYEYRKAAYGHALECVSFDLHDRKEALKLAHGIIDTTVADIRAIEKRIEVLTTKWTEINTEYGEFLTRFDKGDHSLLPTKRLSMQLYQRSADIPLGVPFNIASYAALLQLLAVKMGMMPGDFIHTFGDAHVYANQVDLLKDQLTRVPRRYPTLFIGGINNTRDWSDVDDYEFEVFGYDCHPVVRYPGAAV